VRNDYVNAMVNDVIAEHRTIERSETGNLDSLAYLRLIRWLLYILAVVCFAWPVYHAFLNIEIENNEGWNAYFADAVMRKMPLYPSAAQLITNNYPPLSFYIVGLAGQLIRDSVLAGNLVIAVSIGLGLAYTQVPLWPLARRFSPARSQTILLLAIFARLLVSKQFQPVQVVADPGFRAEIAARQRVMAEEVERVRRMLGDVLCPLLVSYKAGKPFVVDTFNAEERSSAGVLPNNAITGRVAKGSLTIVEVDERTRWGTQKKHFDFGSTRDTRFSSQSDRP